MRAASIRFVKVHKSTVLLGKNDNPSVPRVSMTSGPCRKVPLDLRWP